MNYDESTVERFCSANNFCGMPMWLKYQNYLFPAVEEKFELTGAGCGPKPLWNCGIPYGALPLKAARN